MCTTFKIVIRKISEFIVYYNLYLDGNEKKYF